MPEEPYWLRIVQSYGADSPVLIVMNKSEPPNKLALNETRLRKDYFPNVQGFFETSCATGNGIDQLRHAVYEHVGQLPHVFDKVPTNYFAVKEALEREARVQDFLDT